MPTTPSSPLGLDEITAAVAPVIERAGLLLEAVELPGGEPPVVRVVVDRPSGTEGLGLDMVAELSQEIGELLESGNLTGNEPYDLEVTSPGAARPLTEPRHWARNVGRMVQLKQVEGDDLAGLLLEADENGILLEPVKAAPKKGMKSKILPQVRLEFEGIRRGKVDVEANAARLLADTDESQLNIEEDMDEEA